MLTTLAVGAAASAWPYSCDASLTVRNVTTFLSLSDVTVVVTGATGRSGLQIALAASLANATVILLGEEGCGAHLRQPRLLPRAPLHARAKGHVHGRPK